MEWRDPKRGGDLTPIFTVVPELFSSKLGIIKEIQESGSVLADPAVSEILEPTSGSGKPGLISKYVMEDFISISKSSKY